MNQWGDMKCYILWPKYFFWRYVVEKEEEISTFLCVQPFEYAIDPFIMFIEL